MYIDSGMKYPIFSVCCMNAEVCDASIYTKFDTPFENQIEIAVCNICVFRVLNLVNDP